MNAVVMLEIWVISLICTKSNILETCHLGRAKKKKVWQYKSTLSYNKLYEVNNAFYRGLSKDNGKNINC